MAEQYSGKILQILTLASPIVTIVIGIAISWGVYTSTVDDMQRSIAEIKEREQILENDVHELQLKQATDAQNLINIQDYLKEIKEDIKDMKDLFRNR